MSEINLFEVAARKQYRFESNGSGDLTTEDLFGIPMTGTRNHSLEGVAAILSRSIKEKSESAFLGDSTRVPVELTQKLQLVTEIRDIRIAEKEASKNRISNAKRKQEISEILARRKTAQDEGRSTEELLNELASM